jgi:hypothetical protein
MKVEFWAHLNDGHDGEQAFAEANRHTSIVVC